MTRNYSGKNILITGGSKGIGKAIAASFAKRGANLFLVARGERALASAKADILASYPNIRCHTAETDVSNHNQVRAAVIKMRETMGGIDGLVNNAGFSSPFYFEETPIEIFNQSVAINYLGAVYFSKEVFPYLRSGSFITFTSSVAGFMGVFGLTNYVGPKFALVGFAETLRQEMYPKGIQVSVLCPPDTDTPGLKNTKQTEPFETNILSANAGLMKAEHVAECFLKSLARGKFLITTNFKSSLYYRLNGACPELVRTIMSQIIKMAQKKKRPS